jgi:leucyl aminopeptidase
MKIQVQSAKLDALKKSTLVVFLSQTREGKKEPKATFTSESKELSSRVKSAIQSETLSGSKDEILFFRDANIENFSHLMTVGVGENKGANLETFRRAAAGIYKSLKKEKVSDIAICVSSALKSVNKPQPLGQALAEGLLLSSYEFDELKSKKKEEKKKKDSELTFTFVGKTAAISKQIEKGVKTAKELSEAIFFARRVSDVPGNLMTPAILAKDTQAAAKNTALKVTVWTKDRIKKEKMGMLLGVSKGSTEDCRFIVMEYKGAAKSKKPVCFVGKGLTFDTGGISLKPPARMAEMKYDMCGGANIIGTMLAIAKLKLKINAIGFVPASENMPGPNANKPGDILTARNGKTVEVNNTDAEGRLILGDALVWASEQKPAFIIDAATLTGAMSVALGDTHTGYFTRDRKMAKAVETAAATTQELVWEMPLTKDHAKDMKGTYGDLNNISNAAGAGSSHAAAFLGEFVDEDIPWAHFDIAGTAWHTGGRLPYTPSKGASGVMIRTFVEIAQNWK